MNRILLAMCFVFLFSMMSCQNPDNSGVEVTIEGDGDFSEFPTGTWQADGQSGVTVSRR